MIDDISRPRPKSDERQNKQEVQTKAPKTPEAPHLYAQQEGFMAAQSSFKIHRWHWPHVVWRHATKKERIAGAAAIAVLLIGGGTGVYALNKGFKNSRNAATPLVEKAAPAPAPTTEASKLTGVQVSPELNKRPVTGIMIENSPDARPQSGLKDAGVIYEAIAEGGITRFLVLNQESQPDYIGPVRSVRPYYVDFLLPFDASLVHAGGSADGLAKVRGLGVKDIDHGANGGAFQRVRDRYAPHNLYTSTAALDQVSAARGFTTSNVKSFPRKNEKPSAQVNAKTIDLNISSALYNVHYDYDQASNSYKRSMAGRPHTDHRSGQQLTPKTVVALSMNYSQRGIYSVYETTGSGKAYIFQDGTVQIGNWSKAGEREQFVFTDDAGKQIPLNAGQTWFSIVKTPGNVSYGP